MLNLRNDFPIFRNTMNGKRLTYLDSGASAQKPQIVIDSMNQAVGSNYANIHRGLYSYSQLITQQFEAARAKVKGLINAKSENEIIFTRNATESINLVAQSWARNNLRAGDEVIISEMEHHANIVPWQILRDQIGIELKIIPITNNHELDLGIYKNLLSPKTKIVSIVHISNSLGVVNDVSKISKIAKSFNPEIKVIVDGSQAVVHRLINIQDIGCDFYIFTGHKLYAPTGIGVLWGDYKILENMPPYQGGGDMIDVVTFGKTTYQKPPARFEAGTPAIIEAIGLGAAIDYVSNIGMDKIEKHEKSIYDYAMKELAQIDGLRFFGDVEDKVAIISFYADWAHPSDVAMILDQCGVAVRTGHHCCMPLMDRLGVDGTIRASIGCYNNKEDIDIFVESLKKARKMLS